MNVFPDFGSLSGIGDLAIVIGAMLTVILVVAVLMIIVSAIAWALASSTGNPAVVAKARTGVFVALGAAILAGGAVTWVNWLIGVGGQL
ncbi:MAG: hypothetical protein KF742_00110 [Cryobacterium sp.]|nr:hypothetical protein [Cryobacterium sp.]MCO5293828.1 DUF6112 family protein [Homoserinimonas sp.]